MNQIRRSKQNKFIFENFQLSKILYLLVKRDYVNYIAPYTSVLYMKGEEVFQPIVLQSNLDNI